MRPTIKCLRHCSLWLLLSAALLASQALRGQSEEKQMDPKGIKFGVDLSKVANPDAKWRVYSLATPQVAPAAFQGLIGRFLGEDASKGKVSALDERLVYVGLQDASIYCTQDKRTGNLSLKKSLTAYLGEKSPQLPGPEAGEKVAMEFLQKYKLAPKNPAEIKKIHDGGLRMTSVKDGKNGPVIDKLRTVTFGRQLDGVPVQGSGSKIVVNIGDQGDIVALNRRWREVAETREVKQGELKAAEQAGEELRKLLATEWSGASEITVSRVALVYYDGDGKYIQPAYMFEATIVEGDTKIPYMAAIPALKQAPERIGPAQIPPAAKSLLKHARPGIE